MPKLHTHYVCQQCGRISTGYMGKCPQCGSFNSMVEEIAPDDSRGTSPTRRGMGSRGSAQRLIDVSMDAEERIPVPIGEFARVLGGGIVPGSIVLIGGDPGIGKSTLMLQMALAMAGKSTVLYVSGEESERQIKMRAKRIGHTDNFPAKLFLLTETNLEAVLEQAAGMQPDILIIDSIQTTYLPELESAAGSVSQVRESASRLREYAKATGPAVFVIGHVTKEGTIAGPRILEHIVDTVLYLEGDRFQTYRLLRSVKNRFGATAEVGVFEMIERGLVEVSNPSEAFLAERMVNAAGSAIAVTMEGTRPLLVEVQGLTSPAQFGNARRTPNGVDYNRLLMIVAVLTRRLRLNLAESDIFVNVVGGLKIDEPAADLAIAAAIASSMRDKPVRADTVLIGEIGLAGELRMPGQMPARLREAAKLGFKTAIVPKRVRKGETWPSEIDAVEAHSVQQALEGSLGIHREASSKRANK